MEIDLVFKIAAIGIIVSILNQVLSRSGREEQATMTSLAGLVVVLMMLAQKIADLFGVTTDHLLGREPLKMLDVSGLTAQQIAHLQMLIEDLRQGKRES